MKEVIKRGENQEIVVYSDQLNACKIYGGKSRAGNKYIFRPLANGHHIAWSFEQLINFEYENSVGVLLQYLADTWIKREWQVYEFENSDEALQWMAKKD